MLRPGWDLIELFGVAGLNGVIMSPPQSATRAWTAVLSEGGAGRSEVGERPAAGA